jgi:catechol 2,3-dioxygenase-like lactoylglutathione lyase family enzyme
MARDLRRFVPWLIMLVGCSSQPFCDFQDTASTVALPVPSGVASPYGWGTVLMPLSFEEGGVQRDCVVSAGGPPSQTETVVLARDGEVVVERLATLSDICTRSDFTSAPPTGVDPDTCYERHPGAGLALRSEWRGGQSCVAVGMAGHDRGGGVAFWCAQGDRHHDEDGSFLALEYEVRTLTHLLQPVERIFVGTAHSLYLLDGDSDSLVTVLWPDDDERFPPQGAAVDALSAMEVDEAEADSGALLAAGMPDRRLVLIGEVASPASGEETATLTPRACIAVDEDGFGSAVKLARLEPGGPPVLLAGSRWSYEGREPAVHVFDLDLDAAPADVACDAAEPRLSLRCGPVSGADPGADDGADVDCEVAGSGFGTSFDVGDIDDTPELEVVVGSPGATADGFERAGAAFVFRPARNGEDVLAALVDSGDDRQDAQLGAGVLVAPVGDRAEPVIASPGEPGLYLFLCTGVGDAPPGWDSPLDDGNSLEDARCRNPQQ